MKYQFEEPFIADSSEIANKLGVEGTFIDQAWPTPSRAIAKDENAYPDDPGTCNEPKHTVPAVGTAGH